MKPLVALPGVLPITPLKVLFALFPPVVRTPLLRFTLPAPERPAKVAAGTLRARALLALTVTPLDFAKALPAGSAIVSDPPVTVVAPVNELTVFSVSVPTPALVRPPLPLKGELKATLLLPVSNDRRLAGRNRRDVARHVERVVGCVLQGAAVEGDAGGLLPNAAEEAKFSTPPLRKVPPV